jgi:hypothetical protein
MDLALVEHPPTPMSTITQETMNAGLAYFRKSKFGGFRIEQRTLDHVPESMSHSSSSRLTSSAANIVENIPIVSVTPKPFTGPVPKAIMIPETMSVVRLASMIALNALSKPASSAAGSDLAEARQFLAHALEDQDVRVDRHAEGQHDAGDAGHREGRAEARQHAERDEHVEPIPC